MTAFHCANTDFGFRGPSFFCFFIGCVAYQFVPFCISPLFAAAAAAAATAATAAAAAAAAEGRIYFACVALKEFTKTATILVRIFHKFYLFYQLW